MALDYPAALFRTWLSTVQPVYWEGWPLSKQGTKKLNLLYEYPL